MKTLAFRYAETFAPEEGTIKAHEKHIKKKGYVWMGKIGTAISEKIVKTIMDNKTPRVLLIQSGGTLRHWAYVSAISKEKPKDDEFPAYYKGEVGRVKAWFKITKFEEAPKDIMSKSTVISSGAKLSEASKASMSPHFLIDVEDN